MIKTEFIEGFDFSEHIPKGAKTGLIGCSDCASVFRTADSKTMEAVKEQLLESFELVFCVSLDSPCDQRMLRHAVKGVPGFRTAEYIVVLACEAGSRSLGTLLSDADHEIKIVSPLKTSGYRVIRKDNTHTVPCVFCDTCVFPDRTSFCPVADCPLNRTDGPCQSRNSSQCIMDASKRCSWIKKDAAEDEAAQESSENRSSYGQEPFEMPVSKEIMARTCFLLPPFRTLDELRAFSDVIKKFQFSDRPLSTDNELPLVKRPLFILQESMDSLNISAQVLFLVNPVFSDSPSDSPSDSLSKAPSDLPSNFDLFGTAIDYSICSHASICSAVNTASAVNCSFLFLKEPQLVADEVSAGSSGSSGRYTLSRVSTLHVIENIKKTDPDFKICAVNKSACSADIELAKKQRDAGMDHIFSEIIDFSGDMRSLKEILSSKNQGSVLFNLENLSHPEIASIVKAI